MGLLVKIVLLCAVLFITYNFGRDGARVDQTRLARVEYKNAQLERRLVRLERAAQPAPTRPTTTPTSP